MQSKPLLQLVQTILKDNKAQDIKPLDVRELTAVFDYMVVATATSKRHANSLANKLLDAAKKNKARPLGVEGEHASEWILIDLGDVVVHIMLPETREFYSLEKLWTVAQSKIQNEK